MSSFMDRLLNDYKNSSTSDMEVMLKKITLEAMECIVPGKSVIVVKGRKVPVGTTGVCKWIGKNAYGVWRAKICTGVSNFYIDMSNLKLISKEKYVSPHHS